MPMKMIEEPMTEGATVAIELKRVSIAPEVPPVPVYHVVITRVGDQFLVEPGFVDLVELKGAIDQVTTSGERGLVVQFFVREKLLFTKTTLTQLRDAADELLSRLPELKEIGG